jgi:predicted amidophosphoribosyltransferase
MSGDPRPLTCPVCQARFRGSALCSRCGADLTALMLLAAHAHALRHSARHLLRQGDCPAALSAIRLAQQLHATAEGNLLYQVCSAGV